MDQVYWIEANPQGVQSGPFIAKAHGIPYVNIATKVMLGTNKLQGFYLRAETGGLRHQNSRILIR